MLERSSARDSLLFEQKNNLISGDDLLKLKNGLKKTTQSSKDVISFDRLEGIDHVNEHKERKTAAPQLNQSSDENQIFLKRSKMDSFKTEDDFEMSSSILKEKCLNIPEEVTFQGPSDFDIPLKKQPQPKKHPLVPRLFTEKPKVIARVSREKELSDLVQKIKNPSPKKGPSEKPSFISSKRIDTSVDCDLDRNEMVAVYNYHAGSSQKKSRGSSYAKSKRQKATSSIERRTKPGILACTLPAQLTFDKENTSSSKFELVEMSSKKRPVISSHTENLHIEAYENQASPSMPQTSKRLTDKLYGAQEVKSLEAEEDVDIREDCLGEEEASDYSQEESLITAKSAISKPKTKRAAKKVKKKASSKVVSQKEGGKSGRTSKLDSKRTAKSGKTSKSPKKLVCRT